MPGKRKIDIARATFYIDGILHYARYSHQERVAFHRKVILDGTDVWLTNAGYAVYLKYHAHRTSQARYKNTLPRVHRSHSTPPRLKPDELQSVVDGNEIEPRPRSNSLYRHAPHPILESLSHSLTPHHPPHPILNSLLEQHGQPPSTLVTSSQQPSESLPAAQSLQLTDEAPPTAPRIHQALNPEARSAQTPPSLGLLFATHLHACHQRLSALLSYLMTQARRPLAFLPTAPQKQRQTLHACPPPSMLSEADIQHALSLGFFLKSSTPSSHPANHPSQSQSSQPE